MSFDKSYRYEILLQAIEVFTQRYDLDTLFHFSFEFANELLTLQKNALFKREGNRFVLTHNRLYDWEEYTVETTEKLDNLPLFYGRVLSTNQLVEYFPEEFIQHFSAQYVIPLINNTALIGFMVTNGKTVGEFSQDDHINSDILMRLVNASLENNQRLLDFQAVNNELDRKIFNLFVLNQSIKALLSELDAPTLYDMATDVFSEISGSGVTSFGIYDPVTNLIKIRGYKNVHSFEQKYAQLNVKNPNAVTDRIVLHIDKQKDQLEDFLENPAQLQELDAEYVILIQKEKLLGLVTLGHSRQEQLYDSGTFEIIETLASSTYIALNNAQLFNKLQKQKQNAESKLHVLQTYNRLIRTINSCRTKEELLKLSLSTLELGLGVKKAFFAFNYGNGYEVAASLGLHLTGETFAIRENIHQLVRGEIFYDFFSDHLDAYFPDPCFLEKLGESCGVILAPIHTHCEWLGEDKIAPPYGYLIVTQTNENLKEEEIVLIDTITRNITPLIYHMDQKPLHPLVEV